MVRQSGDEQEAFLPFGQKFKGKSYFQNSGTGNKGQKLETT
jgi:hypothetical protein